MDWFIVFADKILHPALSPDFISIIKKNDQFFVYIIL